MKDRMEIRTTPENAAFSRRWGSRTRLEILAMLAEGPRSVSELQRGWGFP